MFSGDALVNCSQNYLIRTQRGKVDENVLDEKLTKSEVHTLPKFPMQIKFLAFDDSLVSVQVVPF